MLLCSPRRLECWEPKRTRSPALLTQVALDSATAELAAVRQQLAAVEGERTAAAKRSSSLMAQWEQRDAARDEEVATLRCVWPCAPAVQRRVHVTACVAAMLACHHDNPQVHCDGAAGGGQRGAHGGGSGAPAAQGQRHRGGAADSLAGR
jgi:hypothetical protein